MSLSGVGDLRPPRQHNQDRLTCAYCKSTYPLSDHGCPGCGARQTVEAQRAPLITAPNETSWR